MDTAHTISARQSAQLAHLVRTLNAAQVALEQYFSAVRDGLGLPEGTQLIRLEDTTMTVQSPD